MPPSQSDNLIAGSYSPERYRTVQRMGWLGLAGNLGLTALKFALALVGGSQALFADACHSVSDTFSDAALLIGVRVWSTPPDRDHPYGHRRAETLVTLFIGLLLFTVGAGIIYHAVSSVHQNQMRIPGVGALAAALTAIVGKEALYRITKRAADSAQSGALRANAWHHRTDALSSVPVVIAAIGGWLLPQWGYLDPIAAVVVAVMILHAAWSLSRPAVQEIMDKGVNEEERRRITKIATNTPGVDAVHELRTRHLGSGVQIDLHVLVNPKLTVRAGHRVATEVEQTLLKNHPQAVDVLVHLEPSSDVETGSD